MDSGIRHYNMESSLKLQTMSLMFQKTENQDFLQKRQGPNRVQSHRPEELGEYSVSEKLLKSNDEKI